VVVIAVLNGGLHRGYEQALGELRAHQLSGLLLLLLVSPWAVRTERRHPLKTLPEAVEAGAIWAAMTVSFEFLFFHYVGGKDWQELLHDYDVSDGRVWGLVVAGIWAMPAVVRAARLHRDAAPPA
jgi:hypothetical protein